MINYYDFIRFKEFLIIFLLSNDDSIPFRVLEVSLDIQVFTYGLNAN